MPTLAEATAPRDTSNLEPLAAPPLFSPAPPPPNTGVPKNNPRVIGDLPPVFGTVPDFQRNFYRSGTSQIRIPPLPVQAVAAAGAATQSHVSIQTAPIAAQASQAQTTATKALALATDNKFLGAYSNSTFYTSGNQVTFDGGYYVCLLNTIGNDPTNATFWQLVGNSSNEFLGAYNNATAYLPGNEVTSGGNFYICILATTGNAPPNGTYWQQVSTSETYLGVYSGATTYQVGNQVSLDGSYYICISGPTTGNTPSTTSAYWTLLGTSAILIGTWSSGVTYSAGMEVTYTPSGGATNYYVCLQASTNNQPDTSPTYWYLIANNTAIRSAASYRPTTNPLSATDAGSNATITVAAFTMVVGGVGNVSVNGGSLTGLSYGTLYYVYYADPAIAGGAVSYSYTTTKSSTIGSGVNFFVGSILTPVATATDTIGNNDGGTGSQTGFAATFLPTSYVNSGATNPQNAIDGDQSTFAQINAGAGTTATLTLTGLGNVSSPSSSLTLYVKSQVLLATGGTATLSYSINGGTSFTNIYSTTSNRATTVDAITLSATQPISLIQIRANSSSGALNSVDLYLYESWLIVQG